MFVTAARAQTPAATSIWRRIALALVSAPDTAGGQLLFVVGPGDHTQRLGEEQRRVPPNSESRATTRGGLVATAPVVQFVSRAVALSLARNVPSTQG